jgi:uncharacterized protein (DUF58 family)
MTEHRQIWLCREGLWYAVVVLAVLIGSVSRQLNLLMLVGCILVGPFLFGLLYGRFALRRLSIERKLPSHLHADERLVADVRLTNHRRWLSIWGLRVQDTLVRDATDASATATSVSVYFPQIPAGATSQASYQGWHLRRGRYLCGPLRVSTRFPLGLVRHSLVRDDLGELLVHPRLGRLTQDWTRLSLESPVGGQRMQRRGLVEADFYAVRDWRSGDSRRAIHWRTSARRGSLVVRQYEQRRSQDLAILVDLWKPMEAGDEARADVENVISFVATVIAEACRQMGRKLTLVVAGDRLLQRAGAASPLFFREQMDALALIEPHHEPALPAALGHGLALVPPSVPTLLVSTRTLDWEAFARAAGERGAQLSGRAVHGVNGGRDELARLFQLS